MEDYLKQAQEFLTKTGTTCTITFSHHGKHFDEDDTNRDIYDVVLDRNRREYKFKFGSSINDSGFYFMTGRKRTDLDRKFLDKKDLVSYIRKIDWTFNHKLPSDFIHFPKAPDAYSILACLTKYDPGTFEDFCSEFGYDDKPLSAYPAVMKIYEGVKNEYLQVCRLFNDEELEQLQEIS